MRAQDRFEIILEDLHVKFDTIMEYVVDIPDIKRRVTHLETDVSGIKADIHLFKTVLTDHSVTIQNHDTRITNFETKVH